MMMDSSDLIHSGFVTVVGRPNVGKSTLVNRIVGTKVSIVRQAQTTRMQVRGAQPARRANRVRRTPGLHKRARRSVNARTQRPPTASRALIVVVFVVDASGPIARGATTLFRDVAARHVCAQQDRWPSAKKRCSPNSRAPREWDFASYFPVSARTGRGVKALVDHIVSLMPPGPAHYPVDSPSDTPESVWVAELVREQLLRMTHDELPHSITTRVTEWEWPRIRVEILVERESQKGIAIGKGGAMLKQVGTAVRQKLPEGAFLELHVKVERDWQRRGKSLDRLGF